jgi:hypothetical protein
LLIALKGAGYLKLRLEDPVGAMACFEKIAELDTNDRLGTAELLRMAPARIRRAGPGGRGECHRPNDRLSR